MTGNDILGAALALMGEEEREDYEPFALNLLNILLAETSDVNRGLRLWHKKEPLERTPVMASLSEECPWEEELCRAALPYGLASRLLLGDGLSSGQVSYLQNQYVGAVNALERCVPGAVEDWYGGEEL